MIDEAINLTCRSVTAIVLVWLFCRWTEGRVDKVDVAADEPGDVTLADELEDRALPFDALEVGDRYHVVLHDGRRLEAAAFDGWGKFRNWRYAIFPHSKKPKPRWIRTREIARVEPFQEG